MSVEQNMLATLNASTDPALVAARKYYGYAPQDDEKFPTELPILILQRMGAEYMSTTCETIQNCCFVTVQVLHLARDSDEARSQAIAARLALNASADQPIIESENEEYDPDIRAWGITQQFRVFDDSPGVQTPSP